MHDTCHLTGNRPAQHFQPVLTIFFPCPLYICRFGHELLSSAVTMAPPGNTSSPGEHVRFELPPSLTNEPPGEELSSGNSLDDEILIEEDGDYFFDDEERLPFEYKKVLGKGLSAVVEKVQHTGTKEIFAKKAIRFPRGRKRVQAEDHYRNEVDIIRSLKSHRHVIQLFATYTTNREGCLLLQPATNEGNLEDYLENYSDAADSSNSRHPRRDEMTRVLEQAFGCLATGLAYIHRQGIRHKDIKPQNILIHEGFVIYTDFGISKDTNRDGECTTEGLPEFLTKKYSPPEVLENEKRNYAADVYSLGCVFIEMLSALGYSIDHEQEQGQHFSHVMDRIHAQLLSAEQPSKSCFLIETIVYMTSREPMNRPHAETLVTSICCHVGFFCSGCRPSHDIYLRWSGQEHMWYRIRYNTFTGQPSWFQCRLSSMLTLNSAMGVLRLGREIQQWNKDSSYRPVSLRQSQCRRDRYKRTLRTARSLYVTSQLGAAFVHQLTLCSFLCQGFQLLSRRKSE
jgi:serine/threonine protein kinase